MAEWSQNELPQPATLMPAIGENSVPPALDTDKMNTDEHQLNLSQSIPQVPTSPGNESVDARVGVGENSTSSMPDTGNMNFNTPTCGDGSLRLASPSPADQIGVIDREDGVSTMSNTESLGMDTLDRPLRPPEPVSSTLITGDESVSIDEHGMSIMPDTGSMDFDTVDDIFGAQDLVPSTPVDLGNDPVIVAEQSMSPNPNTDAMQLDTPMDTPNSPLRSSQPVSSALPNVVDEFVCNEDQPAMPHVEKLDVDRIDHTFQSIVEGSQSNSHAPGAVPEAIAKAAFHPLPFTKTHIATIPEIRAMQTSYAAMFPPTTATATGINYKEYFDPERLRQAQEQGINGSRLGEAKKLALAILEHYYPADQGFCVMPVDRNPMFEGGQQFWIFPENCYQSETRMEHMKANKSKKKQKKQAVPEPELAVVSDQKLKPNSRPVYQPYNINYRILPENITGYVVLSNVPQDGEDEKFEPMMEWVQHTYLAILMDDLETFAHWVPDRLQNSEKTFVTNPRADILSDAMGYQANIEIGHAMILLGPRLEVYDYHAKPVWQEPRSDSDDDIASLYALSTCFSQLDGDWFVDLRSGGPDQTLEAVHQLFKRVIHRDVIYRNGRELEGPHA